MMKTIKARNAELEDRNFEREAHIAEVEAERDDLISGIKDALIELIDTGNCYDILQGLLTRHPKRRRKMEGEKSL